MKTCVLDGVSNTVLCTLWTDTSNLVDISLLHALKKVWHCPVSNLTEAPKEAKLQNILWLFKQMSRRRQRWWRFWQIIGSETESENYDYLKILGLIWWRSWLFLRKTYSCRTWYFTPLFLKWWLIIVCTKRHLTNIFFWIFIHYFCSRKRLNIRYK